MRKWKIKKDLQEFDNNSMNTIDILKDTKTGVLYAYRQSGTSGDITALVDQNGKPLTSY